MEGSFEHHLFEMRGYPNWNRGRSQKPLSVSSPVGSSPTSRTIFRVSNHGVNPWAGANRLRT